MFYMLCKHKVADFAKWHNIFASHAEAQRQAGLRLLHLLRDTADPNNVVTLFQVDDREKARAFTRAPEARAAGQESGVIGPVEILILSD